MNMTRFLYVTGLAVGIAVTATSRPALADDIDLFITPPSNSSGKPAVLFVLDNTSNWARQAQQWPDGSAQGQSEVQAISDAIATLDVDFSVGVMEFGTEASATKNGGFVAFDISPMDDANKGQLTEMLARIKANINDPHEKLSSGREYGDLLFDVNQYFAGGNSVFGNENVFANHADSRGYVTDYTQYDSPLDDANQCGDVVIVFVSNPDASGPTGDTVTNTASLAALGGDTEQMLLPQFTTVTSTETTVALADTGCIKEAQCPASTSVSSQCSGDSAIFENCECTAIGTNGCITTGQQQNRTFRFRVDGTNSTTTVTPTGEFAQPPIGTGNTYPNADEWARYFYQKGIPLPSGGRRYVRTYTIDVFNKQQNADHTALMQSMARVGGGKYYQAKNQQAILDAIFDIFSDIQSVNSTFASAALPISATNRSQSDNQVFVGMFRPDPDASPRWFGNLKQYQLVIDADGSIGLGDADKKAAVNPGTGFVSECARSAWTFDTGAYFTNVDISPSPQSLCVGTANNVFSDSPDGPRVEKGGVSQILRTGNNPPATSTAPNYLLRRNVYTESGGSRVPFNEENSALDASTVNFTLGRDTENEYVPSTPETPVVEVRPSVHGDVIHSRPQPVNHGGSSGTVVYYGSNDGHFRAVKGSTGEELWSFIAPEFFSRLGRLRTESPRVLYPNGVTNDDGVVRTKKDYFFDGSVGVFQNADSSEVRIYPSMRRGGRMIYGLDVSNPTNPSYMFKAGCPNSNNDTGCTTGMEGIGQTWGTPSVALVEGYEDGEKPVVFVVGGHDECEDADLVNPSCGSAKGRAVFVLDAIDGTLLRTFAAPISRSVVADIALVDGNLDGKVDHGYVADMGGGLYRIDLATPKTYASLEPADWSISRVAYTTGSARKFQFAPALVLTKSTVYIAIGTGDREHPLASQYPYQTPVTNRAYVLADNFDGTEVNLDDVNAMNNVTASTPGNSCSDAAILPGGAKRGWFFDLPGLGEQTVTSAAIAGGLVAFSTNRPTPEPVNACASNLGEARGYLVNLLNGAGTIGVGGDCGGDRSSTFIGGGLPPSPVITRVNIDGQIRTVCIGCVQKDGTTSSAIEAQRLKPLVRSIRRPTYWFTPSGNE